MRAAVIKKYAASAEVEEVKASISIEEKWPIPQAGDYDVRGTAANVNDSCTLARSIVALAIALMSNDIDEQSMYTLHPSTLLTGRC